MKSTWAALLLQVVCSPDPVFHLLRGRFVGVQGRKKEWEGWVIAYQRIWRMKAVKNETIKFFKLSRDFTNLFMFQMFCISCLTIWLKQLYPPGPVPRLRTFLRASCAPDPWWGFGVGVARRSKRKWHTLRHWQITTANQEFLQLPNRVRNPSQQILNNLKHAFCQNWTTWALKERRGQRKTNEFCWTFDTPQPNKQKHNGSAPRFWLESNGSASRVRLVELCAYMGCLIFEVQPGRGLVPRPRWREGLVGRRYRFWG